MAIDYRTLILLRYGGRLVLSYYAADVSQGASIRLLNVGTWAAGEHVVQPTVPSPECVGCLQIPAQKRAPSDDRVRQGLVAA